MAQIDTFEFEKDKFYKIKLSEFGSDWPVVYMIENGQEIYIGESVNVYSRSKQHFENAPRRLLKRIHVVADEEFNKSATLDIESSLIQYFAADGNFVLQNSNLGLQNHNYYDRQKYQAKFESLWEQLRELGLAAKSALEIKNSELFKYSPYKSLAADQMEIVEVLLNQIKLKNNKTFIVEGGPGTGKTILATYLMKALAELPQTKNMKVALVVPMTALRKTLKKVFRYIKGVSPNMVIGPNEVTQHNYDLLIVDEAHRLRRRKNITNYKSFDDTNKKLGLDREASELDWVMRTSKSQILFYDQDQSVRPSDVRVEKFRELVSEKYKLKTQLRVAGGEGQKYIGFVENIFDNRDIGNYFFNHYDFKIFTDLGEMLKEIKKKEKTYTLCRMVSGYAWAWASKNDPSKHDIEIDGIKLVWNSVNHNWVNSANAINEVGCIHTVQGYDLNYAGVIIGPEISYDLNKKEFRIHPDKYMDINGKKGVSDDFELERYIINIYKTLMTRGILGTYVYIVDPGLREYFQNKMM